MSILAQLAIDHHGFGAHLQPSWASGVVHALQESSFSGNNAANSQGGALALSEDSVCSMSNSTMQGNTAARGAGIYIVNSTLTVEACNFSSNAARSTGTQGTLVCRHVCRLDTGSTQEICLQEFVVTGRTCWEEGVEGGREGGGCQTLRFRNLWVWWGFECSCLCNLALL